MNRNPNTSTIKQTDALGPLQCIASVNTHVCFTEHTHVLLFASKVV